MPSVQLYDTTLRDGAQREGISFSVVDKLNIVRKLDELGIHYIEGGWPGSNPRDAEFFERVRHLSLTTAQMTVFGSTRRVRLKAEEDSNLVMLVGAGVGVGAAQAAATSGITSATNIHSARIFLFINNPLSFFPRFCLRMFSQRLLIVLCLLYVYWYCGANQG